MIDDNKVNENKYIFKSDNKFINNLDLLKKRLIQKLSLKIV